MFLFFCSETRLLDGGVGQFLKSAVDSLLQYLGVRCLDSHGACEVVDLADASRVHIRFRDIDSVLLFGVLQQVSSDSLSPSAKSQNRKW